MAKKWYESCKLNSIYKKFSDIFVQVTGQTNLQNYVNLWENYFRLEQVRLF